MPNRSDRLPPPDAAPDISADRLGAESLIESVAGETAETRPAPGFNRVGSRRYLQAAAALFLAGFGTFSLLYCVQPLLPTLARVFGVGAAASSLAISCTTGLLALSIVAAASLSDLWGRKPVMAGSLALAAACNAAAAVAPTWSLFLGLRALEGVALGGVPAVAMTYLAEETEPAGLGLAMGLYVGSTAVGGMGGRVIAGLVAAAMSWRAAVGIIGLVGLGLALAFVLLLPASRHFRPRRIDPAGQVRAFAAVLRRPALLAIYAFGFLIMGGFVAVYNYAGFRLEAQPYGLDQAEEGMIFTLYLLGTVSSALAGALADRFGRAPVMAAASLLALGGVVASLFMPLGAVVLGIALVTFGFFAGHAVASGSIGGLAGEHKGQAASLYLLSYYAGSSLLGTAGGWFWSAGRWPAVAGFVAVLFGLTLVAAAVFHRAVMRKAQGDAA